MSAPRRALSMRPSVEQQRRLALQLLYDFGQRDPVAIARIRAALPSQERISFVHALFVLAREHGFESWAGLKAHIEHRQRVRAVIGGRPSNTKSA
jgi:hypothetical protein